MIRDRIKEFRRVPASQLIPNPKNWRTHPDAQKSALRGVLEEIGFADACLARELPTGELMLVDGHLRAETAADETVPVLVLDVTEDEADTILATLDPLAAMAVADEEKLAALLGEVSTDNESVKTLLDFVSSSAGLSDELVDDEGGDNPYTAKIGVPPYEVTGPKPTLPELCDSSKAKQLLAEIEASGVPEDEKEFLRMAAMRHVVFDFERIANYYAGSDPEVQRLFENSACVIVDVDKAIENGWARLSELLRESYASEKDK